MLNLIRAVVTTQMSNAYLCVNCNAYGMDCINPGWAVSGFTFFPGLVPVEEFYMWVSLKCMIILMFKNEH